MELGKKKQRKEKNQQKIQNNDEIPENNGIYKLFILYRANRIDRKMPP